MPYRHKTPVCDHRSHQPTLSTVQPDSPALSSPITSTDAGTALGAPEPRLQPGSNSQDDVHEKAKSRRLAHPPKPGACTADTEDDCYPLESSEVITCGGIDQAISPAGRCYSHKQDVLLKKLLSHLLPGDRQEIAVAQPLNQLDRSSACSSNIIPNPANYNSECSSSDSLCRRHHHRISHSLETGDKENADRYSARHVRPVQEMLHHVTGKCKDTLDCRPYQGPKTPPSPKCVPKYDQVWANDGEAQCFNRNARPTTTRLKKAEQVCERSCCCTPWSARQLKALLLCLLDNQMGRDSSVQHPLHRPHQYSPSHFCADNHEPGVCTDYRNEHALSDWRPLTRSSNASGEPGTNCLAKCQCLFAKCASLDHHRINCTSGSCDHLECTPRREETYAERTNPCRGSTAKAQTGPVLEGDSRRSSKLVQPLKEALNSRHDYRASLNQSASSYTKRLRERRVRSIYLTSPPEMSYHNDSHRSTQNSELMQPNEGFGTRIRTKESRSKPTMSPCRRTSKTDSRYSSSRNQHSAESWMSHHQTHSPPPTGHHYRANHRDQRRSRACSHLSNHYQGPPSVYDVACSYNQPAVSDTPQSPEHSRKGCHDPAKQQPLAKLIRSRITESGPHRQLRQPDYRPDKRYEVDLPDHEDRQAIQHRQQPRRLQSVVCSRPEKRPGQSPISSDIAVKTARRYTSLLEETQTGQSSGIQMCDRSVSIASPLGRKSPDCQGQSVSASSSDSDNESDSTTNTDDSSSGSGSSSDSSDTTCNSQESDLAKKSGQLNSCRVECRLANQTTDDGCAEQAGSSRSRSSSCSNRTNSGSSASNRRGQTPAGSLNVLLPEQAEPDLTTDLPPVSPGDKVGEYFEQVVEEHTQEMPGECGTGQMQEVIAEAEGTSQDDGDREELSELAPVRQDLACCDKGGSVRGFPDAVTGDLSGQYELDTRGKENVGSELDEEMQVRGVNLADECLNEQVKPENKSPGFSKHVIQKRVCEESQCQFGFMPHDSLEDVQEEQRGCAQEPSVSSTFGVQRIHTGENESFCSSKSDGDNDEVVVTLSNNDVMKAESSVASISPRKGGHLMLCDSSWRQRNWKRFSKRPKQASCERYLIPTDTRSASSHGIQGSSRSTRGREGAHEWMENSSKDKPEGEEGEIFSDCTTEIDDEALEQKLSDKNHVNNCPTLAEESGRTVKRSWETWLSRKRQGERPGVFYRGNQSDSTVNSQVDQTRCRPRQLGRYGSGDRGKPMVYTQPDFAERCRLRSSQQLHRIDRGGGYYTKQLRDDYAHRSLRLRRLGVGAGQGRPGQLPTAGAYISVRSAPRGRLYSLVERPSIASHGPSQTRYAVPHGHSMKYPDGIRSRWDPRVGIAPQASGQHRNRPPPLNHYQAVISGKHRRSMEQRNN